MIRDRSSRAPPTPAPWARTRVRESARPVRRAGRVRRRSRAPRSFPHPDRRRVPPPFDSRFELIGEREQKRLVAGLRGEQIGRASCRDRVCQYVLISGGGGALKKQNT